MSLTEEDVRRLAKEEAERLIQENLTLDCDLDCGYNPCRTVIKLRLDGWIIHEVTLPS